MLNPKHIGGESITSGKSDYYISQLDIEKIKNKNVLFVDDVFSTGATFENMIKFSCDEHFKIVAGLAILKEGKNDNAEFEYNGIKVYCCGFLPLPEID